MSANLVQLLYLVSGVLFILALRGLSHPRPRGRATLRHGRHGARHPDDARLRAAGWRLAGWLLVILGLAIGGGIGAVIARRVPMTAMPQLVAAFHSGVGLAAVFVAAAALYAPQAFGIGAAGDDPRRPRCSRCRSASPSAPSPSPARSSPSPSSTATCPASRSCCRAGTSSISASPRSCSCLIVLFVNTESHGLFWLDRAGVAACSAS